MKKILIIGATSAIAEATAKIWAEKGEWLFLVARNNEQLEAIATDLRIRGCPKVEIYNMDVNNFEVHLPMLQTVRASLGDFDIVLIAHGTLADQKACEESIELTLQEIRTNALSTIALLTEIANQFERQKKGIITVISSVAGDRGRESNYIYGASKAMINAFTSGLRQRLYKSGVTVITVKPGFTDTPMTKNFNKGILWSTPQNIAKSIDSAVTLKKDIIYTPKFWRAIMLLIRLIPECIFKRLSL